MRVHIASDHAGFELKRHLIGWLAGRGYEPVDCGPATYRSGDDYPPYVLRAATEAANDAATFGIVIGGSGNGEAIAANKVAGVRAALVWSAETARLARRHNNANVVSLGSRMYDTDAATSFVEVFLTTPYSGAQRHARRIGMITRYEQTGDIPPG
ncbi:MAG: ribose-5-phosphate isomerase [Nocardioidaceae bacterium]